MKKVSYSIFAALVLILSACMKPATVSNQYAGIVTAYAKGQVIKSVVAGIATSKAQCEEYLKNFAAELGTPPIGVSAELSCVELVPFKTVTAESAVATPHSTLPGPKTDSI